MAAVTPEKHGAPGGSVPGIEQYSGPTGDNSSDTFTTPVVEPGGVKRLSYVLAHYSAAPTQAGVTVTLDSARGSAFDTLLNTFAANAQNNVFFPAGDLWLLPGDAILVSVPAGGAGITGAVIVVLEDY